MNLLRQFEKSHLEVTYLWIGSTRIRKDFLLKRNISWEDHLKWNEQLKIDSTQKIFAIINKGHYCGNCGFKFINADDSKAELWIYLGDPGCEGKGIAKLALIELIKYGFETLKLNKIYLHVADFNLRAIEIYKRLGFKSEGFFVDDYKKDNTYFSIHRFYLLNQFN